MDTTKKATDKKPLKKPAKAPAKNTATTKNPEPVKNNITFFVSAKGTVLKSHVSERYKERAYFRFNIEGSHLQLHWSLKGTSQTPVRVLNASLAKNSADELCTRLQQKLSPGFLKILRPIFAWLIECVKNDTLDQPKVGRGWREMPKKSTAPAAAKLSFLPCLKEVDSVEHNQEPDCSLPCLKDTVKPATENVFSTAEFVQRTKVWQLAQVTGHDALVCRKMLEKHGYDLDAAYAEFLDYAERTARKVSGSVS